MTWQKIQGYLQYRWRTVHIHGVHSPFVFQLYEEVIADDRYYYSFDYVEDIRSHLRKNQQEITVTDFGAGSSFGNEKQRKISQIVKSASSPKQGQFLFRLVNFLRPQTLLELGTNLGIGTLYMAEACTPEAKVYTFEGCPNIAHLAQKVYEHTHLKVNTIVGNLDDTLQKKIAQIPQLDFVYFDANHRLEPTLRYFELCLPKVAENSVFIFDDIYHSNDMKQAWQTIQNHPKVMLSIDLFELGLVFFRTNQPKQHFYLDF